MKQEQQKVLVKFYEAELEKQVKALKLSEKGLQVIHDEISKMIKGKAAITIEELQSVFEINMYDPQVRLPKPNEEAITELIINRHIAGTEMGGLEINREFHWCPVKIMFIVCKSFIFSNIYSEFLVHDLKWLLLRFPSNSVRNEFRQNSFRSNYAAHSS